MFGHAGITLMVDTYGRWVPMGNKANVDGLGEDFKLPEAAAAGQSGSNLVAKATPRPSRRPQVVVGVGDPPWTRTMNPEIKSLLLYQLS
jgi:hypothetical protein